MSNANFEEVTLGNTSYKATSAWKVDESIVGTYLETLLSPKFQTKTHMILLDDGSTTGINGCGQLDKKFATIAEGSTVKVIYKGKEVMESGNFKGNEAHQFSVLVRK